MPDGRIRTDFADRRLTALFAAHHGHVVAYVARRTRPLGDQAVAEDVAAEVYLLAWQSVSSSAADAPALTLPWLLATAGNVLRQRVSDDMRRVAQEERAMTDRTETMREAASLTDPADVLAFSEVVARALDRMQPLDRELLLLRVWDELSFAEAAEVLGCSPGAARVRWLRARRRFAVELTREEPVSDAGEPDSHPSLVTPAGGPQ